MGRTLAGKKSRGKGKRKDDNCEDGAIVVLEISSNGDIVRETHRPDDHARDWISDIKFDPRGNTVAVGGHDRKVHLYNFSRKDGRLTRVATCGSSSSAVTHIDFDESGDFIQTNDQSYELLWYNTANGKQVTSATATRDVEWDTWTCTLGWPVQGIWPPFADGSDINATDRSLDKMYIASADDDGSVKLFHYPCITEGAGFQLGTGHSSHVTNVRFMQDVEEDPKNPKRRGGRNEAAEPAYQLVTTGGNDRSIIVWAIQ